MPDADSALGVERIRIVETIYRWAACIDRKDWAGFGREFTDPVEIAVANAGWESEVAPRMLTRDQWAGVVKGSLKPYCATQHFVSNYRIEVMDDQAYALSYVIAPHIVSKPDGRQLILNMGGYYEEHFTRIGGIWKINRHKLTLLWTHGDPEALALIAQDKIPDELR